MPAYFGVCDSSGNYTGSITDAWIPCYFYGAFVCPGSGNQTVKELSGSFRYLSGAANIRLAVYSSDSSTKICEGDGEVALPATEAWTGHMTQTAITPNPATLVGGTTYVIAGSIDATWETTHAASGGDYANIDYTGGFPSSLPLGSAGNNDPVRCGVDPEAAGGSAIDAESGSFPETGQAASLLKSSVVEGSIGSFSISGQDVTLTKTGELALSCDGGIFSISGQSVSLLYMRVVSADGGSFTQTGSSLSLLRSNVLSASEGSYGISGYAASLLFNDKEFFGEDVITYPFGKMNPKFHRKIFDRLLKGGRAFRK